MFDSKLAAREKKIFDAAGKTKDRFKLLMGVGEEEFASQDISSLYRKRAQAVIDLYQGYVNHLGKVLTLEQAIPVMEVLQRVLTVMHDSVRDGWCQEFLGDEIERYLHIDNHPSVRKGGLKLLLLYIDAVGSDCLGLLLSVFDWNTLRLMSDPQPGLFLPPSVRVLTAKRHAFIPKKLSYKEDDNTQRDINEAFTEVFDFLSCTREGIRTYEKVQFRWSLFKSTLAPILFPHCVHTSSSSFASAKMGFQGIYPGITVLVLDKLLFPILSLESTCGVILDECEDFQLVNYIFRHALGTVPADDLLPCYRVLQLFQTWVHSPKHQVCISKKYSILESILAVFLNLQAPLPDQSAVQAKLAIFEVACDIFVQLQDKGEDERSLRLWIDKAVVPVYKGADLGIPICELAQEMVSRSMWVQILTANVQSTDMWEYLSTFLLSMLNTCGQGVPRTRGTSPSSQSSLQKVLIQTVPHTDVAAPSVNPLVLHWRIIVGNILRMLIGHCSEAVITRPYSSLAISAFDWTNVIDQSGNSRSDSPVGDMVSLSNRLSATQLVGNTSLSSNDSPVEDYINSSQTDQMLLPPSTRASNLSMNSHDELDMTHADLTGFLGSNSSNNKTVLSLHRQAEGVRRKISQPPDIWVEELPSEEVVKLWYKLLRCLTLPGMEKAVHPSHFVSISHTVSDVVSDLLFCSSSHRVVEPWKRAHQSVFDPPSHLLSSAQRPISLHNSSVSAALVTKLAVDIQIRYLSHQLGNTSDFNISAKEIAMGTLCDLLCYGGKLPKSELETVTSFIIKGLELGDHSIQRVIFYRLYPVSVSDVTHHGHAQHFFEHHHYDTLSILAPLVLSINQYASQSHRRSPVEKSKRVKVDSETPVKTASASMLGWMGVYVSELVKQGHLDIQWPEGYTARSGVATYNDVMVIIKNTLIDLTSEAHPVDTRITAVKGLAAFALVTSGCGILSMICKCVLDFSSTELALTALSCTEVVLLWIDASKKGHEALLSDTCSQLATALIILLRRFTPSKHCVRVVRSLVCSITEVILSKPDIISNTSIMLVTDSISYACQSRMRSNYWVQDCAKAFCENPQIATTTQPHPSTAFECVSEENPPWWSSHDNTDEAVLSAVDTICNTAEIAMDHLTGLFRNFPVCAATDSSTSSQAAPDIRAVGGENVYLSQNGKALITLTEIPTDPGTVYLTSRTTTGRYCWELRKVGANGAKSTFPMTPDVTVGIGHGQARSQSGALVGRSRTQALHESTPLNSECDLNNRLSEAMEELMPSYLSNPSTGPPVDWTEQFKDCVATINEPSDVMTDIRFNESDDTLAVIDGDQEVQRQQQPLMPHSMCKCFLATGPLLSYRTAGMVLTNESAVFPEEISILNTLETSRATLHQQLCDIDNQNSRDQFSVAVMFALPGQGSASEILGNSNCDTSTQYERFLQSLGWTVDLRTHVGYTGGLEYDAEAHPSMLYFASATFQVSYHVTTLVGLTEEEVAVEQRRRLISADPLQIIWCEGENNYNPSLISAPHVQYWVIVNRFQSSADLVRISLTHRVVLPPHVPLIDGMCVPVAQAAHLIRYFCLCVLVPHRLHSALSRKTRISEATRLFKKDTDNQNLSQAALSLFVRQARVAT
eukprot:TRINITY_DN15645_c0_g1_i1.p1 TRINITY_DN15645_c0_g1~~TRINITY_DN15645_c0_g1_i1.p1  ORF type:complete len:1618 (+),score=292.09 TRINITY_DN15645_c0_g1_i1:61-4914(+)